MLMTIFDGISSKRYETFMMAVCTFVMVILVILSSCFVFDGNAKATPQDAQPYFYSGTNYLKEGQYGRAIADYGQAISLDQQFTNVY